MSVEVKYEVRASDGNPFWFFVLDSATQGILQESAAAGSYDYVLGGSLLVDITDRVKSINVTRGKNRAIDVFDPSLANIVFDNSDRTFDPLYADSDFYGAIKPNRTIAVLDNTQTIYLGIVQDWNISYDISGESIAAAAAADAMSLFALQNVAVGTATEELSSTRVTKILEQSGVSYPYYPPSADPTQSDKNIYTGSQTLGADVVEGGTTVLDYLQLIELSEPGKFFIDKFGRPTFVGRNSKGWSESIVVFADDGSGIAYSDIQVNYGSEYLFNNVIVSSAITSGTATAEDLSSQEEYKIRTLTRLDLLMSTTQAATDMAIFFASKYSQPQVRFERVSFIYQPNEATSLTSIEIGDIVQVKFTPLGIGSQIVQYAEVIGIDHEIDTNSKVISFTLDSIEANSWRLNDPIFGRLSAGNTLAY